MSGCARLTALVAYAAAITAIVAPSATASSGEITKELANPEGTEAEIAGSVSWTGCTHTVPYEHIIHVPPMPGQEGPWLPVYRGYPAPYCGWLPFATVGPGQEESDCLAQGRRDPGSLGQEVALVWSASERRDLGQEDFDVTGVPLGQGQLVCLSAIEVAPSRDFVCAFYVGFECPPYVMARFPVTFASASIETDSNALSDPSPGGPPVGGSSTGGPGPSPTSSVKRCAKRRGHATSSKAKRCKRRHASGHR